MNKDAKSTEARIKQRFSTHARWLLVLALVFVVLSGILYVMNENRVFLPANLKTYWRKCDQIYAQVVTPAIQGRLGQSPAGDMAGHAVFLSLSDGSHRAHVYTGTGSDLHDAWDNATKAALPLMNRSHFDPRWIRVDVVCESESVSEKKLSGLLKDSREGYFRRGLALDSLYDTALLETELNSYGIYDYDKNCIDRGRLSRYLLSMDRPAPEELPRTFRTFRTLSWFCDENDRITPLTEEGLSIGRRPTETVDAAFARQLILNASDYLADQVREDGSFRYGIYPRFGNDIDGYNILRHAGTLWALICRYRIAPEEHIAEAIHRSLDFLLTQVVEKDENTAYVFDAGEFKLGGCALSVIALTEYTEVFGDRQYEALCRKLGNGILSFQDPEEGSFVHVLHEDFTLKEATRTVYYDGEATFALCRLYAMTREAGWLEAARKAADYFVREDYTEYCDHWISYALNDLTDYTNEPAYYTFALRNMQENLDRLYKETAYQTALELLGTTWQIYDRMTARGIHPDYEDRFHVEDLRKVTAFRVQRLLDNYFFPETAMYLDEPDEILGTFSVRHQHFRTRIDDVQHSIGGLLLYRENYGDLFPQP